LSVGERLAVGLVRGIHGLRGAVRVEVLTDRPEDRFRHGALVYREGSTDALTVSSAHADEPGWLVRFTEIGDRTAAETLRDAYLEAEIEPGEELPRGEYYWHEVVGTPVLGIDGTALGTIEDVYRAGGAEVFVVRGGPYGEFDLPAVRAFIRIFAPKRGEIVVDVDALELEVPKPPRARGRRSRRAEKSGFVSTDAADEGDEALTESGDRAPEGEDAVTADDAVAPVAAGTDDSRGAREATDTGA
jgi:16S rRNA processing protein RimM